MPTARALVPRSFLVLALIALPAIAADLERGRALYENHCAGCHTSKIHGRPQRLPADAAGLASVVERWQAQQNLGWSREEIGDVVYFLRVTQYNF